MRLYVLASNFKVGSLEQDIQMSQGFQHLRYTLAGIYMQSFAYTGSDDTT